MPRFAANISLLFTEYPLLDRPSAAADAGFGAVEMQFPYDVPVADLLRATERAGIGFALFNLPVGDLLSGGPGLAAIAGREGQFRAAVAEAKLYVQALKPGAVNVLAGWPPVEIEYDRTASLAALAGNLRYAAAAMAPLGARVVTEPINTIDRPRSLLSTSSAALEVLDAAGHANLGLQYDVYHMTLMEGDVLAALPRLMPCIGHIQFADVPGRHEPGTGEIDFTAVFAAIDSSGYRGWVGAEYAPSGKTTDSLAWLRQFR